MHNFDYDPIVFLRCHSKSDKEYADVRTEIWGACFEPSRDSNIVATCGGNKICLIDVETGEIEQRYSADNRDVFYTLAWKRYSIDNEKCNVLVAGGLLSTLYFICPSKKKQITYYPIPKKMKSEKIFSLLFHPKEKHILFCAMDNGDINVLEINLSLNLVSKIEIITKLKSDFQIHRIALCKYSNLLFAATTSELYGWNLKSENKNEWQTKMTQFNLPKNPKNPKLKNDVDSVEVLKNGFIASKCALHGVIYIWHIHNVEINSNRNPWTTVDVVPRYVLNWSSTDNYYLEISADFDTGLLSCGDDKGSIWLYDISCLKDVADTFSEPEIINPVEIINWPTVNDIYLAKSRKLDLEVDDIVITKAAIHPSGKYIVVITSRNTVCLWSKNSVN